MIEQKMLLVTGFLLLVGFCTTQASVKITGLSPQQGSAGGDTELRITGSGFSATFDRNADESVQGTHVFLFTNKLEYPCITSASDVTANNVICRTMSMEPGIYRIKVKLDGHIANEHNTFTFEVLMDNTPEISDVTPKMLSLVDSDKKIRINGKIISDKVNGLVSHSTNGKSAELRRVRVTGGLCSLVDEDGHGFNTRLENWASDYGQIECYLDNGFVGCQNVTFMVDDQFGLSIRRNSALFVNRNYKLCNFESFTTFELSENTRTGGVSGGTELIITGEKLKERPENIKVFVGGDECILDTDSITETQIKCKTPPQPTSEDNFFPGSSGLEIKVYAGQLLADVKAGSGTNPMIVHASAGVVEITQSGDFTAIANGYFAPPATGKYTIKSTEPSVAVYLSTNDDSKNVVLHTPTTVVDLEAGKLYALVLEAEASNSLKFQLEAIHKDSLYISSQTTMAKQEKQRITTTSKVQPEIQVIKLTNFPTEAATPDPDETGDNQLFKICSKTCSDILLGCFEMISAECYGQKLTIPLSEGIFDITKHLNRLHCLGKDIIIFTRVEAEDSCLFANVSSNRGNIPLTFSLDNDNTIAEETKRTLPVAKNVFTPSLNGIPGLSVDVLSPTFENDVEASIQSLMSVQCPDAITTGIGTGLLMTFEPNSVIPDGIKGIGEKSAEESYCGTFSAKNPGDIYYKASEDWEKISALDICFAYKGKIKSYTYTIEAECNDANLMKTTATIHGSFEDEIDSEDDWVHVCHDVKQEFKIAFDKNSDCFYKSISLERNGGDDLYIDNIFMGEAIYDENDLENFMTQRRPPVIEGEVKALKVEAAKIDDEVTITMHPAFCGHNIPLIGVALVDEPTVVDENEHEYTSTSWDAEQKITVKREEAASPPITGTFGLEYECEGEKILHTAIACDIEEDKLKRLLEADKCIKEVEVTREGECHGYTWDILFYSGGDHPLLEKKDEDLAGNEVEFKTETIQDGGLTYSPLHYQLRKATMTPEVTLFINNMQNKCGTDCTFTYDTELTPTITSVSPASAVSHGDQITITGTKFTETTMAKVGGADCNDVVFTSATEITCSIGDTPAGDASVMAYVPGLGEAVSPQVVSVGCSITQVTSTANKNGGNAITISGNGFGTILNTIVEIGSSLCKVTSIHIDVITCTILFGANSAGDANLIVTTNDVTCTATGGQATISLTDSSATVTKISHNTLKLNEELLIQIDGSGFGSTKGESKFVFQNTRDGAEIVASEIKSWEDTKITFQSPILAPGEYYPLVVKEDGNANIGTAVGTFAAVFKVTDVSPTKCGPTGDCAVDITGDGFKADMQIYVGDKLCKIIGTVLSTAVKCNLPSVFETHVVRNSGYNRRFGPGLDYDKQYLTIEVGDTVKWIWDVPVFTRLHFKIQFFNSPLDEDDNANDAVDATKFTEGSGDFAYQFTKEGTYYYRSVCVDPGDCDVNLQGTVKVVENTDKTRQLKVKLANYYALDEDTTNEFSETIEYKLDLLVFVTNFDPKEGNHNTLVTATGEGFIMDSTVVYIGDAICDIETITDTEITFKINPNVDIAPGRFQPFKVTVEAVSSSLLTFDKEIDRYFALYPYAGSISPAAGSILGGTLVTIEGYALKSGDLQRSVKLGTQECLIDEDKSSYNQVVCRTTAGAGSVKVEVRSNKVQADYPTDEGLVFEFVETSSTTSITGLISTGFDGNQHLFDISGTGFTDDAASTYVALGDTECAVTGVTSTVVSCKTMELPVGTHSLTFRADSFGYVPNTQQFVFDVDVENPSLATGSDAGALVSIKGKGFTELSMPTNCIDATWTWSEVTCVIPPKGTDDVFEYNVAGTDFTYTYDEASTPTVTAIEPSEATSGDRVTITGTKFQSGLLSVTLGGEACEVDAATIQDTSFDCVVGEGIGGATDVQISLSSAGFASLAEGVGFKFRLEIDKIEPNFGGFGGGQEISIDGKGFNTNSIVTICGEVCELVDGTVSSSNLQCLTPALALEESIKVCDVSIKNTETMIVERTSAYEYIPSHTSEVDDISKTRGGTAGGTTIVITGKKLSGITKVSIAGSDCIIESTAHTDTSITCVTEPHQGTIKAPVLVFSDYGKGINNAPLFSYVDVWSSKFTWGGVNTPVEGSLVVVSKGQTLIMDTTASNSKVMKMIVIDGGSLIFDRDATEELVLQAEYILILNGGRFEVGTKEAPFEGKARIIMHGHVRSKELPIYGAKVLALREGVLSMYGKPKIPWSLLAQTAKKGSKQISTLTKTGWTVGDMVVIATTGDSKSQHETENHLIVEVIDDQTYVLEEELKYDHLGEVQTCADGTIDLDMRAEVASMTRNIVFEGNNDPQWNDEIEPCPNNFDPGEFATQTCFKGRFEDTVTLDSNEHGAIMFIHAAENENTMANIEYVEFSFVGQANRLGRYPIHFHKNGDVRGTGGEAVSSVRGNSIRKSFNRCVVIHATNGLPVEWNVSYDTKGGCFFIEDGIERDNIIQYNLAIRALQSTSLLNDDVTPAAFWVTNAANTVRHNRAAGGSHFGFWYKLSAHPERGSFDPNVCPQKMLVQEFSNNTVHSCGWFGLWTFITYTPMEGGGCGSNVPATTVFDSLTTWNSAKGAETVIGGAIVFNDAKFYGNEVGYAAKDITSAAWKEGRHAGVYNSKFCRNGVGIELPQGYYMNMEQLIFGDQIQAFSLSPIQGTCTNDCGGFTYRTGGLEFINLDHVYSFKHENEGIVYDIDGSLTGTAGSSLVPWTELMDPSKCTKLADDHERFPNRHGVPAAICKPSVRCYRWAMNGLEPKTLSGNDVIFTNNFGNVSIPYHDKRKTHKKGYMAILCGNKEQYTMSFKNGYSFVNLTYNSRLDNVYLDPSQPDEYIEIMHELPQTPDRAFMNWKTAVKIDSTPSIGEDSKNLDWHYDVNTKVFKYILRSNHAVSMNSNNLPNYQINQVVAPTIYRCYYEDCILPESPEQIPPSTTIPEPHYIWDSLHADTPCLSWTDDLDSVTIPQSDPSGEDCWLELRKFKSARKRRSAEPDVIEVKQLVIEGTLFMTDETINTRIIADYILIKGRILVGMGEKSPFSGKLEIVLRGKYTDESIGEGISIPPKTLGCIGGCDFHGLEHEFVKSPLTETAAKGSKTLKLQNKVTWSTGDEIVVTTTSFNATQSELATIASVSTDGTTLELEDALDYGHTAYQYSYEGKNVDMRAYVGLLSSNIIIRGDMPVVTDENEENPRYGGWVQVAGPGGWGRFSRVEFKNMGQFSFVEPQHGAVTFNDIGVSNPANPCFVKKCGFSSSLAAGISAFKTSNATFEGNVFWNSTGSAIAINTGAANSIIENLATYTINQYNGKYTDEYLDLKWPAVFDLDKGTRLKVRGNLVAGSEVIGYNVPPVSCDDEDDWNNWSDNTAHGVLQGVNYMGSGSGCSRINGFNVFKAWDYGIYYQTSDSVQFTNMITADSRNHYAGVLYGANPLSHDATAKSSIISDSLSIGRTHNYNCDDSLDGFIGYLTQRAEKGGGAVLNKNGGFVGTFFGNCLQAFNKAPKKKFMGSMSYPMLRCHTEIKDSIVANWGTGKCGTQDSLISTNIMNEDAQFPVYSSNMVADNVIKDNVVAFHRASLGKINPSDCVDMECDGVKQALVRDTDGSLFGMEGAVSVIPESQFGWTEVVSNPRGLGDYRIPKFMLTEVNGDRIPTSEKCPYKGVVGNRLCDYSTKISGSICEDKYNMLVYESMDHDTETRRLSPVGLIAALTVDLNNGPQDHGWCAGYTCQKRISNFYMLTKTGLSHELCLTGSTPKKFRLHYLSEDENDAIVLAMCMTNPMKKSVSVNGQHYPANGIHDIDVNSYATTGDGHIPSVTSPTGTNYFDYERRMLYVTVRGSTDANIIEVEEIDGIYLGLKFEMVTTTEFYDGPLIDYLTEFLKVDKSKVMRVDPVRENRKKRSASRNKRDTSESFMLSISGDSDILAAEAAKLSENTIGTNKIKSVTIEKSISNDEERAKLDTQLKLGQPKVYSISKLHQLTVVDLPHLNEEGKTFDSHIHVRAEDSNSDLINGYGHFDEVRITATLKLITSESDTNAVLGGTKDVKFDEGIATFNDLDISHSGNYKITFKITNWEDADTEIDSDSFTINKREVSAKAIKGGNSKSFAVEDEEFEIKLSLIGSDKKPLSNIDFKGYSWKTTAALDEKELLYPSASLSAMTEAAFDNSTGETMLKMTLTGTEAYHKYNVKFNVWSEPDRIYDFHIIYTQQVYPSDSAEYRHTKHKAFQKMEVYLSNDCELYENDKDTFKTFIHNEFVEEFSDIFFTRIDVGCEKDKIALELFMQDNSKDKLNENIEKIYDVLMDSSTMYRETALTLLDECAFQVNHACYPTPIVIVNATISQPPVAEEEGGHWHIIGPLIGVSVLIAVGFVALAHYFKVQYRSNQVTASTSSLKKIYADTDRLEHLSDLRSKTPISATNVYIN